MKILYDGLIFTGNNWRYASSSMNSLNYCYGSYTVKGPQGSGVYKKIEYGASNIIKEIADNLGIKYSPSAGAAKMAELILKQVLGDKYRNPKRGASQTVCNHAIFDNYLLDYVYENDGLGFSDSIKKNAHIYIKQ